MEPGNPAAQAGLRRLFGSCTEGEGLYQLQQAYVQDVFNPQVPDSPTSYYGTIAGKGRDIRNILLDGEDDGLVTVNSVQYLSRTDHPERGGLHWNLGVFDVNHTGLLQGQGDHATKTFCGVYPGACIPVIGPAAETAGALTATATSTLTPEWSWTAAATVPADGSVDVPVEFEGAENAAVLVVADDPTALTGTVAGQPLQAGELLDVGILQAELTSPADGTMTLHNHSGADVDAVALVVIETSRRVTVDVPAFAGPGAPVPVTVTVTDAQPGDQPEVQISDGTGTVVAEPALTADGTGRWTATYTPVAGGTYMAAATIPGARARTGTAIFSASPGGAAIAGTYQTSTPDRNGNGLHDALVADIDVTAASAGQYRLAGKLVDSNGNTVATAGARADLHAGTQPMRLEFPGLGIFRSGLDGPYQLVDVTLSDADLQIHDHTDLPGETAAYLYRTFEHFPVEFDLGSFTDRAEDLDGDDSYDQLTVTGAARVDTAGTYAFNARLVTTDGTEIGRYQTTRSFTAGTNSFELRFDWDTIADAGINGPWIVRDLTVYPLSNSDAAGFLPRAHTTAAYDLTADEVSFAGLLNALAELIESGDITHHGLIRSLEAKLDSGSAAYDRGDLSAAAGTLDAFRQHLAAQRDEISADGFERLDSLAARLLATL